MEFPSSYFEDEVRDGFFVPGMVKRSWAAQMEVLEDIAKVCEKYAIPWFMDCGSLLGTIRHGGFIPWDDDIDICMLRDDFERFKLVAQTELPENYDLLTCSQDGEWTNLVTRVVNGHSINFDVAHLKKYHDFPYVTGLDIFALDYLSPNSEEEEFRKQIMSIVMDMAFSINSENQEYDVIQETISKVETMCGVKLNRNAPLQPQVFALLEGLASLYSPKEAKEVALMYFWVRDNNHVYKKEYFKKSIKLSYECMMVPVPLAYDKVLSIEYGDYMRISQRGGMHDYPFFKVQEEQLIRNLPEYPFKYKYSKEDLKRIPVVKEQGKRKEVVLMPYRASSWNTLESVWKAALEDEEYDVYVIPVPYCDRNALGDFGQMHYDGDLFPDYVQITRFDTYDFEKRRPDIIITQNPYDECNYTSSVHPMFYAKNLKQFTPELVYMPYFETDVIARSDEKAMANMSYYVTVPGLFHADRIVLQSEQMRELYIDVLTEFAGEDTRAVWEKKIVVSDIQKRYKTEESEKRRIADSVEWGEVLRKEDGSLKKAVLYHTGIASWTQNKEKMLDKIRDVLQVFEQYKDRILLIWRPDFATNELLQMEYPELWEQYDEIVEHIKYADWLLFDEGLPENMVVGLCDAYFGDASSLVQRFRNAGKPIMIQNVEMLNKL